MIKFLAPCLIANLFNYLYYPIIYITQLSILLIIHHALVKGTMIMAMPSRGGITTINYDTIEKLYASYLPFIENGALFIPTNQQQQLGSQTFVAITLPNSSERMPLHGKVVWVNHRAQAQRPAGYALQLGKDEAGLRIKNEVDRLLAGHISSDKPTFTL